MSKPFYTPYKFTRLFILLVIISVAVSGCRTRYVMTDRGLQAYYQTGYPILDTSRDIGRIFQSVKRINVVGYYDTFLFNYESGVTLSDINRPETYRKAEVSFSYSQAKAGTATIISENEKRLALLTNDHVVNFPDTLIFYFDDDELYPESDQSNRNKVIERISIRYTQINMIYDMPRFGQFKIIARDQLNDIAVISIEKPESDVSGNYSVLDVKIGEPEKLSWGSFVYVLGYPKGYKMVSRAIVSDPGRDRRSNFLIDGQFNEGVSGGIILAIRAETGEMEFVGMARATSATTKVILVPEERNVEDYSFYQPYRGNLFVDTITQIEYGITIPVSMKSILDFFRREESVLKDEGFYLSRLTDR